MVSILFAVTIFLGAFVLFLLEPLVGKSLLPHYGGTPAVWNTCVFFFQLLLLVGYLYADVLHRFLSIRRQVVVHALVMLFSLLTLPLRFKSSLFSEAQIHPLLSLLVDLTGSIGFLFFVVSTTGPLLQAWYSSFQLRGNPYLLYVASNIGSLIGLLIYPAFVEFYFPLSTQCQMLTIGFVAIAVLVGLCGKIACDRTSATIIPQFDERISVPRLSLWTRGSWFLLSMCPSSLMLGETTYLSTKIAPMPAIWMMPLSLYLLSFIFAFANPPKWCSITSSAIYIVLAVFIAASEFYQWESMIVGLILHNGLLFSGALALHCQLSATRPDPKYLTQFYLWISFGGLCGSVFNTLFAPLAFNWLAEYPLGIALGILLLPLPVPTRADRVRRTLGASLRFAVVSIVLLGMSWDIYFSPYSKLCINRQRTFFGEFHIERGSSGVISKLLHGQTLHGMQIASEKMRERRPPLTYYFFTGPIGQLIVGYRGTMVTQSVGVVGLGIGSLASYAEPGEQYTFYEIDPAIAQMAEDTRYFTFLSDARQRGAKIDLVFGDARLRLREAPDKSFGLLVLDAFTSDAVPVHLLTRDAIKEYQTKLQEGGMLAFHISNQFVDLEPVLANIAKDLGLLSFTFNDLQLTQQERRRWKERSIWVVMAASDALLEKLLSNGRWHPSRSRPDLGVWTDDQSNLLSVVRWRK